ncbi:hypothetical protein [Actinomadura litoris]|uniref:hypothetical protein n=1 Tax=Actinomadura litoris TaxID=2678616 RepID=UPI001FA7B94A|nr:hypothetical protein [Actinomadura litoris]
MGVVTVTRIVLACDGCGTTFGGPVGLLNPMEARAAAYAEGWRFPNRLGRHGELVSATSDVCPGCIDDWEPRERAPRQREATYDELREWTP